MDEIKWRLPLREEIVADQPICQIRRMRKKVNLAELILAVQKKKFKLTGKSFGG